MVKKVTKKIGYSEKTVVTTLAIDAEKPVCPNIYEINEIQFNESKDMQEENYTTSIILRDCTNEKTITSEVNVDFNTGIKLVFIDELENFSSVFLPDFSANRNIENAIGKKYQFERYGNKFLQFKQCI